MRETYLSFTGLSDQQWQALAKHGSRQLSETEYALHYDPAIAEGTKAVMDEDVDLWPFWSAIQIPQLLIWGETSDVLQEATVRKMQENPQLELISVPDTPHVPSLMIKEQIEQVQRWLQK